MAKDKEKLKRLKKQQKERTAQNKEKREREQREREVIAQQEQTCDKNRNPIRDLEKEEKIFRLNFDPTGGAGLSSVYRGVPCNDFERDMQKGVVAYRSRHYVQAAKEFLGLLEKYPDQGMAYYYIANSFSYMLGGMEYSLRFYQKALEFVDYVEVWVDYGNILRVLKRTDEAIEVLEEARKRFCSDGSPARILQNIYTDQAMREHMRSEALCKKCAPYNEVIREWQSEHQILRTQLEDFV